jgi:prolyl oligopeptidase
MTVGADDSPPSTAGEDDPRSWLEDVLGDRALAWVRARNDETLGRFTGAARFEQLRSQILAALDSTDRIAYPQRHGEHLYNFWRDDEHPRGLWRRATLVSFRTDQPEWDVLLDVDALAAAEDENWVFGGAQLLLPSNERALVSLSRGGADAAAVREFDLTSRAFVPDGFTLPEAKSLVEWIDRDTVFVGTDFGPGSLTDSGYPRVVRRWRRGTDLADADEVFAGLTSDVSAYAAHDPTPGFERDFVGRAPDFFTSEEFWLQPDGQRIRLDVPDDAETFVQREWLLIRTRSPWHVGDTTHPAGALLATRLTDFVAGKGRLSVLFAPDAHSSLEAVSRLRDRLILNVLVDVANRLELATPPADDSLDWTRTPLIASDEPATVAVVATSALDGNEYFLETTGFTRPSTLSRGVADVAGETAPEPYKQAPAFFDATGMTTRQFFATSDDGTAVPYFVVGRPDADGPVLLNGYGGFEVSLTPRYSSTVGLGWLARGGTYVVANIRGGGEYGPGWHEGALRGNRLRAYEDFAAVARDLVSRGVTTPERLGIVGGSNGGLLMGVMLTRYPQLFGAIVCQVPLLDMRRYHRLLAGASWMAEYGNPDDPADWEFIRQYSPYHNLGSRPVGALPPVLFTTSTRDDRVHPGHARKMTALMRERGYRVEYYENVEGGHGGAANNAQSAFAWALAFEFLWRQLGPARPQERG